MGHIYSAENHDWDLTLRAAHDLFQIGSAMDRHPRKGSMSMGFSALTGSMLLSFSSIESFSASVAFCMPKVEKFAHFDFEKYRRTRQFWSKLELLFSETGQEMDKSKGLFQTVSDMQRWRNLVTHASPYRIEETEVENTTTAPGKLHKSGHVKEYTRLVDVKNAARFYKAAFEYIEYLKAGSGLEPRAMAAYTVGHDGK